MLVGGKEGDRAFCSLLFSKFELLHRHNAKNKNKKQNKTKQIKSKQNKKQKKNKRKKKETEYCLHLQIFVELYTWFLTKRY